MSVGVMNILDLATSEDEGKFTDQREEFVRQLVEDFSTKKIDENGEERTLNPDIEVFLKRDALQFAKEKKSVTYLVVDEEAGDVLGYFTITHKPVSIPPTGLSKTDRKRIGKFAQYDEERDSYTISAFLIAQFGKNYAVDGGNRISGNELMRLTMKELNELQHRAGDGVIYLDAEADASLIEFYQEKQQFRLFGERISEKDGKRYLQFFKFF